MAEEIPETPETPEVPETPETPEVPETPETPETPESTSLLEDPEGAGDVVTPTDWPDDWAMKLTDGDEKQAAFIKSRHASPVAYHKALNAEHAKVRSKLSKGEVSDPFPTDGTDEEKTAWRTGAGVPVESTGYLEDYTLDDGFVIGEDDREFVDSYLAKAHGNNEKPETVKNNLSWYFGVIDKEVAERKAQDDTDKVNSRDELRDEMGADFQRNIGAAFGLLDTAPETVKTQLLGARLADGTALGNHPDVLRWLTGIALDINPAATVVPGGGSDSLASIDGEIAEIEKRIKTDRPGYFADEPAQARYGELLAAKEKLSARNVT